MALIERELPNSENKRRGRDSNPWRGCKPPHRFSKPALSATQPPLRKTLRPGAGRSIRLFCRKQPPSARYGPAPAGTRAPHRQPERSHDSDTPGGTFLQKWHLFAPSASNVFHTSSYSVQTRGGFHPNRLAPFSSGFASSPGRGPSMAWTPRAQQGDNPSLWAETCARC